MAASESNAESPADEKDKRGAWSRVVGATDAIWSSPIAVVEAVGNHLVLLGQVAFWSVRRPFRVRVFLESAEFVGFQSLLIVSMVSLFVGMVFALQSVSAFRTFGAETYVGSTVALALTRELAPVFTSIVIAARAGAGMATELGSMRITEQIDALSALAVNPVQFLVVPRVIATTIMVPFLCMLFNFIGMLGAYLVSVVFEHVDRGVFVENTRWFLTANDLLQGVCKAAVFGLAISLISCYQGFYASGGAKGVGVATTRAVVASFVTILVLDYFLTDVWLGVFGSGH